MSKQIILTSDELDALQAALDEPMTVDDAEEILEEYGYTDYTICKDPPAWYTNPEDGPYRVFLQLDMMQVEVCNDEKEVVALAEKVLLEE